MTPVELVLVLRSPDGREWLMGALGGPEVRSRDGETSDFWGSRDWKVVEVKVVEDDDQ